MHLLTLRIPEVISYKCHSCWRYYFEVMDSSDLDVNGVYHSKTVGKPTTIRNLSFGGQDDDINFTLR